MSDTLFREHLLGTFPQTCLSLRRKLWSLEQFAKYAAGRARLASEYARGLERLGQKTAATANVFFEESGVTLLWAQVQEAEAGFARAQTALAVALQERVADQLALVKTTTETLLRNIEAEGAAAARAPVVLLTHIPLHNNGPDGAQPACDAYSVAWTADTPPAIREQTHLTPATSARLLAALRPALVFAGHDHRGCAYRVVYCDTTTNTSGSSTSGNSTNSSSGASVGERRVVQQWTVRSVMGEHRGNAQLLAIGRRDDGAFAYAVSSCALGLKMVHYVWAAVAVGVYVGARVLLVCVPACVRTRRHRGCAAATKHKSD